MIKGNLWIIIVFLALISGGILVYKQHGSNLIEFSQIISAYATFVLAFLTAAYVFTTSRQLSVMQQQLSEMKKNRELENQPFEPY